MYLFRVRFIPITFTSRALCDLRSLISERRNSSCFDQRARRKLCDCPPVGFCAITPMLESAAMIAARVFTLWRSRRGERVD